MVQFQWLDRWKDGQKDGQILFYRTILATARGPKSADHLKCSKNVKSYVIMLDVNHLEI